MNASIMAGWRKLGSALRWLSFGVLASASLVVLSADKAPLIEFPQLAPEVVALVRTNGSKGLTERMAIVTNAPLSVLEKVQGLSLMFSGEDREGQRRIAHVVVRLADDSAFPVVQRLLMEPGWHPQVHSVFMTGTLKSSNAVKLPVLLELARTKEHPLREEARQLLEHILQADHGSDWPAWQRTLEAWLKAHP
jgi:hypothetical protein